MFEVRYYGHTNHNIRLRAYVVTKRMQRNKYYITTLGVNWIFTIFLHLNFSFDIRNSFTSFLIIKLYFKKCMSFLNDFLFNIVTTIVPS